MRAAGLEAVGDVFELAFRAGEEAIQALVGGGAVEGAAFGPIRSQLQVIEGVPDFGLHLLAAAVERHLKAEAVHMLRQVQKSREVLPFPQEEKTVDAEVIGHQLIDDLRGERLSYIQFQER